MRSMTNWQLYISAGLPTVTGLVTIAVAVVLNGRMEAKLDSFRSEVEAKFASLRDEIGSVRGELISRIDRVSDDQKQFYMILGEHKGKIESMEKR